MFLNNIEYTKYHKSFQHAANNFGTPFLLFDEGLFLSRISEFSDCVKSTFERSGIDVTIQYAAKAFLTKKVAALVSENGLHIDTCSLIESLTALQAGVGGSHLGLHGNNKSDEELRLAISEDFSKIFIDSISEVERVSTIASELGKSANVLVRITTGVHAGGHEFISTAHEDQKFGLSLSGGSSSQAFACIKAILEQPNLNLIGIHSHIGSQIWDESGFVEALEKMLDFRHLVADDLGFTLTELDLGGGFGVQYLESDPQIDLNHLFESLSSHIIRTSASDGLPLPKVSFEPGRWLMAPCMSSVYSVGGVKDVEFAPGEFRRYVSVDGGMSDNIRPVLYDAKYSCFLIPGSSSSDSTSLARDKQDSGGITDCRIVGKHCESGDILIQSVGLSKDLKRGDLLIIPVTGAYGYSMASNYNLLPKPAVVTLASIDKSTQQQMELMIPRQTPQELIR
jgi:diaminopimelate decarboxylase